MDMKENRYGYYVINRRQEKAEVMTLDINRKRSPSSDSTEEYGYKSKY